MKKAILLVSHSQKITDGIKEMIEQMAQSDSLQIFSLGGTSDGELGSDPMKIIDVINEADSIEKFFVFADLGSAVLSAELAFDMLEEAQQEKYVLVDAPLVEGAFAAGITASVSDDVEHILLEAKNTPGKGWK
ncbi:dihydroxyacetone kinase phosphoryl donor subunit DhaM [Enterococcus dongliensis]|uniref:phosphoenolpyruvate--glycerone phosphotransferase n=1 Tax=Enterococcus dongliensis TaxID=2559925 RepID=A0AAP5U1T1_9ENTE|nr:dihydroxyacetone kinase phosphoryl donor subunit DhaM [Enterococcus dongliensis]MDT2597524.1 dihydroxyacetone kinase phosphoryl donor subunit DhaM [Enterococcus dongliensis]MDT2604719.1 dihydroxyacetone kinase phosphoryl donor subunit DhaM [Enterococcus dongliensis]MDT2613660.1 dihydroxyacetone kinase phosphoryl donor subunit DhaM [Enterococcus dongliensis]MDT2635367.1 dihydroxyacetone kinase phosphoryl donor subunit DhaM [Enterococcus dongliensis]MDT2638247.1 dihydroxyacetone kinase phosph